MSQTKTTLSPIWKICQDKGKITLTERESLTIQNNLDIGDPKYRAEYYKTEYYRLREKIIELNEENKKLAELNQQFGQSSHL